MGLVGTVLSVIGFGIGLPVGLLIGYFFFIIYLKPSDTVQEPIIRPLHELDSKTLQALLPEIPSWVKSPEYERIDWLNKIIDEMWPYLDKAICNTIRSMTKPIFDQYIGTYHIESIEFDHLTLGSLPPTINGVKVLETQEKVLVFEPGIRWASNCNITMSLKLLSFKVTVQVLDLQISLAPRVTLKPLVSSFPCFANLNVCLMEKPQVDFGLKLLGGDLMAIPILYRFVQDTIVKDPATQVLQLRVFDWEKVKMHDKLGMQVIPLSLLTPSETKEFTLDLMKNLNPNDPQNKRNRGKIVVELTFDPFKEESGKFSEILGGEGNLSSVRRVPDEISSHGGVLSLTVEGAEDVEGKHHNNPYAIILFRGESKKTKVIKKTRDPRWNEEFQFVLEEAPLNEKIHIKVMSKRKGFNFYPKESLGLVDINLTDVVNNGRINERHNLINSRNGVVHIDIRWSTV